MDMPMLPSKNSRITHHASRINRRTFLRTTAAASSAFMIVPSHVLGLNGKTPPSEKVNIAGIGIGGQGASDLEQLSSENIVALCDVDAAHAAHTFKRYPKAKVFTDFRKMLDEQKDIDAVMVATPDHLHAFVSMTAIKHGKHVYCEKPLTHSVWEAREIAKAAREQKVATQMGNQGQASEDTRRLCEYIMDDAIGPVREVHIWTDRPSNGLFNEYWPQGITRPKDTPPVPATLDWDLWLGPAPSRPYHPAYLPFKWRGWWDFGTGALGDIGCHAMDPVFRALKLGAPLPVGWGKGSGEMLISNSISPSDRETARGERRVSNSLSPSDRQEVPGGGRVFNSLSPSDGERVRGEAHYPLSVQASSTRVNTETYPLASMITYEFPARGEMPPLRLVWYDGNLRPPRPPELEEIGRASCRERVW